jgi:ABC-type lipoprotein export system ATPase subunit
MGREIMRLFRETEVASQKTIVMAGHEDGIITFGRTVQEAYERIGSAFRKYGLG